MSMLSTVQHGDNVAVDYGPYCLSDVASVYVSANQTLSTNTVFRS